MNPPNCVERVYIASKRVSLLFWKYPCQNLGTLSGTPPPVSTPALASPAPTSWGESWTRLGRALGETSIYAGWEAPGSAQPAAALLFKYPALY